MLLEAVGTLVECINSFGECLAHPGGSVDGPLYIYCTSICFLFFILLSLPAICAADIAFHQHVSTEAVSS